MVALLPFDTIMNSFTERLVQPSGLLWIEYENYAGKLLSGGKVPWLEVDQLINWQRKAAGLLPTDVVSLSVAAVVIQWLSENPKLVEAMGAKQRPGFALRTLLADPALRKHLVELSSGLRACFPKTPLALVLPSPAVWVSLAHEQAFPGEKIAVEIDIVDSLDQEIAAHKRLRQAAVIDMDAIDSAAVYIADFLRGFSDAGIDILLLEESSESEPSSQEVIDLYKPLLNLSDHYRWALGIKVPTGSAIESLSGPDFWIAPRSVPGVPLGLSVSKAFWSGEAGPKRPDVGFVFLEIPANENPEHVLERLSALR